MPKNRYPAALLWLSSLLCTYSAHANLAIAAQYMPQPHMVGNTTFRVLLWDIYDATLYAPHGRWQAKQPYALRLTYHRGFSGTDIAARSAEEIHQLGYTNSAQLERWQQQMQAMFPDVGSQSQLTGVRDAQGHAHFYHNKAYLGQIADPDFSHWFFGIWLAPNTQEPSLRRELLGQTTR